VRRDLELTEDARRSRPSRRAKDVPIIISGDFNIDINKDPSIIQFLKEELNLDYIPTSSPTTLGNTTIDLTFARNISTDTMPFVSYFSYHRPIIRKVAIEY
jgi:hypothetical protein